MSQPNNLLPYRAQIYEARDERLERQNRRYREERDMAIDDMRLWQTRAVRYQGRAIVWRTVAMILYTVMMLQPLVASAWPVIRKGLGW